MWDLRGHHEINIKPTTGYLYLLSIIIFTIFTVSAGGTQATTFTASNFLQPCQFINQILVFGKLFVYDTERVGLCFIHLFYFYYFI